MTITCSPDEIIGDIVDLLKEVLRDCYRKPVNLLELREKYKELLQRVTSFEKEYIDQCYVGGRVGEIVLSWIRVAKLYLSHCVEMSRPLDGSAGQPDHVDLLSDLLNLYGMNSDQMLSELKRKTALSRRIKELYIRGIEDKVKRVEDENLRRVLDFIWNSIESDLKKAVLMYVVDERMVELILRLEMLRDKGLNLEDMIMFTVKSEIRLLFSEVQNIENKRSSDPEDLGRVLGSLRKLIELVELASKLGLPKTTTLNGYIKKLESLAAQLEQLARITDKPVRGLLGEMKKTLEEMHCVLE